MLREEIWHVGTEACRHVAGHGTVLREEIWHVGTEACRHVAGHGTVLREEIWHVGTLGMYGQQFSRPHKPNLLSPHDHRFHFWGNAVVLNIDDSYPQQASFPLRFVKNKTVT